MKSDKWDQVYNDDETKKTFFFKLATPSIPHTLAFAVGLFEVTGTGSIGIVFLPISGVSGSKGVLRHALLLAGQDEASLSDLPMPLTETPRHALLPMWLAGAQSVPRCRRAPSYRAKPAFRPALAIDA